MCSTHAAENVNFSCGRMKPYVPHDRGSPVIAYSTASHYRHCYQQPQASPQYDADVPVTRFGSTPRQCNTPAVGVGELLPLPPSLPSSWPSLFLWTLLDIIIYIPHMIY